MRLSWGAVGRPPGLERHVTKTLDDLDILGRLHVDEGREIESPDLGRGMDDFRPASGFDNVVDEARKGVGRADMPDLAPTQAVDLRIQQFGDEIFARASVEKIDRDEQGRSIGQKVFGQMT